MYDNIVERTETLQKEGQIKSCIIDLGKKFDDVDLAALNEARRKLEELIDLFHERYHPWPKPRTDRKVAMREYFRWCLKKEHSYRETRYTIRRQLKHICGDLGQLEEYMENGYAMPPELTDLYLTIRGFYHSQRKLFHTYYKSLEQKSKISTDECNELPEFE